MRKKIGGLVVVLAVLGGGWFIVREKAARDNAGDYLVKREIPTYHALSLHTAEDKNLVGYCKPCGAKARAVVADRVGGKIDDIEKAITGK